MAAMESYLRRILHNGITIVAHNMKFEALVIYHHFPRLRKLLWHAIAKNKLFCTKLYEKLLNNNRKKQIFNMSLSNLVKAYFETDISETKTDPDAWRLRYSELDGVPKDQWPKAAVDYAIDDSIWAYKVRDEQVKTKLDFHQAVRSEICLSLMGQFGITVDHSRAKLLETELKQLLEPYYKKVLEKEFARLDKKTNKVVKNMKKLREYIKENIPNPVYTAKGGVSTTAESLTKYTADKPDEILESFIGITKYEKILTAFVPDLKAADPYIRSEYNSVVSSGRTSSSKSSNYPSVNIQQMPREVPNVSYDVRNCFIPRTGYKIVSIDYNGLELASTAHMLYRTFKDSRMRDTINSGHVPVDMHSKLAARLMSLDKSKLITYEEFLPRKKEKEFAHFRQLAKPINLGFPGGIGYDTMRGLLAKDGITPKFKVIQVCKTEWEAVRLMHNFKFKYPYIRVKRMSVDEYALVYDELVKIKMELYKLYPELECFLKQKHTEFMTGETVSMKNDYGEWEKEEMYAFDFQGIKRNYCTYTAFCNNYLMQSPSAIGAKNMVSSIIETYFESDSVNPLAFIHDEIVVEIRDDSQLEGHVRDLSLIMINEMQKVLPSVRIAVEAEVMPYWMKSGGDWSITYWKDNIRSEMQSMK